MNKIDEIAREFYGKYGYAMHTAQMLERGLLEIYALKKYISEIMTEIEYYKILLNPKKWTLGTIINKVIELGILNNSDIGLLKIANKNRIFLAHKFWWERNIEFENEENINKLHRELVNYITSNVYFIPIIDKIINQIRVDNNLNIEEKMGLTDFNKREKFINSLKQILNQKYHGK